MSRRSALAIAGVFWLAANPASACPFCDQGGFDAARFILSVFVPFAVAMAFVLLAARRSSTKNPPVDPSRRIFEAENTKESP